VEHPDSEVRHTTPPNQPKPSTLRNQDQLTNPLGGSGLRPPLRLASRWINLENPTDTMPMIKADDGFDVRSRLPGIQTETLVIYGAKDRFWPLEMVAETAFSYPGRPGMPSSRPR
jgi:pimeloyl-ACP methyl ester carboxylesterase